MASGGKPFPDAFIEFLKAVEDMKSTVMVPHVLVDLSEESLDNVAAADKNPNEFSDDKALPAAEPIGEGRGLYSHYQMLLRVKEELTTGHKREVNGHFRNQVRAVVESLKYFTNLANAVTQNYCQACEERNLGTIRRTASDGNLGAMKHEGQLRAYRQRKLSVYFAGNIGLGCTLE